MRAFRGLEQVLKIYASFHWAPHSLETLNSMLILFPKYQTLSAGQWAVELEKSLTEYTSSE